jgi:hypothetical protein
MYVADNSCASYESCDGCKDHGKYQSVLPVCLQHLVVHSIFIRGSFSLQCGIAGMHHQLTPPSPLHPSTSLDSKQSLELGFSILNIGNQ